MQTNGGGRSCSDGESAGLRQACASCKHQRKRCAEDCFLAKYFPAEKQGEFRAVQKVFGLSNLTKMLRANATEAARQRAARTLAWEAEWRDRDPADGCFREVAALRSENRLLRDHITALAQALTCQYPTLRRYRKTPISSPPSFVDQGNFSPFDDDDESNVLLQRMQ
uniref:LOB domain-containing protein n=1 Tax=Ananas comosus var. bracteatus TaxID=296719 RepID=A0A6V7QI18_ANACO|nr:unnamed protein product [Ananas comosus var. bracteatus]